MTTVHHRYATVHGRQLFRADDHRNANADLPGSPVMRPAKDDPAIYADMANAVFASALQRSDEPSTSQIRQAVAAAICSFGGPGCAGRAAQEFGDHPETAVIRMRWARVAGRAAIADSPAEALR